MNNYGLGLRVPSDGTGMIRVWTEGSTCKGTAAVEASTFYI